MQEKFEKNVSRFWLKFRRKKEMWQMAVLHWLTITELLLVKQTHTLHKCVCSLNKHNIFILHDFLGGQTNVVCFMNLTFVFHPIPTSKQIYLRFREKNWKQLGKKEAVAGFFPFAHSHLLTIWCFTIVIRLDPHQ